MLEEVLERLERLERASGLAGEEARVSVEIALAFAASAREAVEAARRVSAALSRAGGDLAGDGVARAIVEVLAARGPMTLRGLEREVRRLRGTASRGVIRERLRRLEELGVVRVERRGRRLVISLAEEAEDREDGG